MSLRDVYEAVLVEMNRVEDAPNILLEDFNYFANKAINQYINKKYNIYDMNQQSTDDLQVLKTNIIFKADAVDDKFKIKTNPYDSQLNTLYATYVVELPEDYVHILNCQLTLQATEPFRCYDAGQCFPMRATKLTADMWNLVVDNFWNRPTYRNPYYYLHNANGDLKPTSYAVNQTRDYDKLAGVRYGNRSKVICEIRMGPDKGMALKEVLIDYLKAPEYLRLTQLLIDTIRDDSLILEFPDYVCQEIVNELVHIIMENVLSGRLLTHPVVSLSIALPAQQLASQTQQ